MMPFQDQEKGLFTFYKQQADLQEQLKHLKTPCRKYVLHQQENKHKIINLQKSMIQSLAQSPPNIRSQQYMKQIKKKKIIKNNQKQMANYQFSHPLNQLLQRYKGFTKLDSNDSVILRNQFNNHLDYSPAKNSYSTTIDRQKKYNNRTENKQTNRNKLKDYCIFVDKKLHLTKGNPLQKKVLSPTSFDVQMEENIREDSKQSRYTLKNVGFRQQQFRYARNVINSQQKEDSKIQMQSPMKRQMLPQISKSHKSQAFKRYDKVNGTKRQYLSNTRKKNANFFYNQSLVEMDSDNFKNQDDSPQMISLKKGNRSHLSPLQRKATQNLIYPLFIQNRQLRRTKDIQEMDREKILLMIVKKMKFT